MARELFADNLRFTVSSGGTSAPSVGTVETWTVSVTSGSMPAVSSTAVPVTTMRIVDLVAPTEWMLVTNAVFVSGSTWTLTVTRGVEGATVAHTAGFTAVNIVTAGLLNQWSQNAPWFNVLDYGADPTGVSNSTTAINAAVVDASAVGGTVLIPRGSYLVMTEILALDNVTIYAYGAYLFAGQSSHALVWNYTPSSSPTVYTGHSNITILGGIWDNKGHVYNGSTDTMYFGHARNITIRDLTIRNTQFFHGIELNSCSGAQIVNCRFEGAYQGGGTTNLEAIQIDVALTGAGLPAADNTMSKDILVQGCYAGPAIDGSGLAAPGWLVAAHSSQGDQYFHNIRIIGNEADSCIYGGYRLYCFAESLVSGNIAVGCSGPGIKVEPQNTGGYHLKNFSITGNVVSACTGAGIDLGGLSASNDITNVAVTGNNIVGCGTGISAQWTNSLSMTGNIVDSSGVAFSIGHCTDVIAANNVLTTCSYGIDSVSVVQYSYTGNDINGATNVGIYLSGSSNGIIANNIISSAVIGIQSPSGSSTVLCTDNQIIQGGTGLQGILLQSTTAGWTVYGNDVSNGTWSVADALTVVTGTVVTPDGLTGVRGQNIVVPSAPLNPKLSTGSLASFTSEAVVGTFTIPANDPVAGGYYRFRVHGTAASTGTPTYTFRVRLGGISGTVIASFAGVVTQSGVSNAGWEVDGALYFITVGASGTLSCNNTFRQQIASTTPPAVSVTNLSDGTFGSIDTTVSEALVVTVQCSASSASNVVATAFGQLERVY